MKKAYERIADRSLDAADHTMTKRLHEKATFLMYHAYESIGCALAIHFGLGVGAGVKHGTKLKRFRHAAAKIGLGHEVARLNVRLASLRNLTLYPGFDPSGAVTKPEDHIKPQKAQQLLRQVRSIVQAVKKNL